MTCGEKELSKADHTGYVRTVRALEQILEKAAKILYPGNHEQLMQSCGEKIPKVTIRGGKSPVEKSGQKLIDLISSLIADPDIPALSAEGLTLRAVLVKCLSGKHLKELSKKGIPGLSKCGIDKAYKSLKLLQETGEISQKKQHRKRLEDEVVEELVKFILSDDNVRALSWGTKTVKLDCREEHTIPRFVRKKPMKQIYK